MLDFDETDHVSRDMLDKPTKWPTEIECYEDGCDETCWLMEDQGYGCCSYECPVHGGFGVQYDDDTDEWCEDEFGGLMLDPYYDDDQYADDALDWSDDA